MKNIAAAIVTTIALSASVSAPAFAWSTLMDNTGSGFFNYGSTIMGYGNYAGTTLFLWD